MACSGQEPGPNTVATPIVWQPLLILLRNHAATDQQPA